MSENSEMGENSEPSGAGFGGGTPQRQPDPNAEHLPPFAPRTPPGVFPSEAPAAPLERGGPTAPRGGGMGTPRGGGQGERSTAVALPRGAVKSIHYELSYVVANPGAGPRGAIVLLHDLPGGAFAWDGVMPAFGATGRAIYAFDLLGYGQSEHPWPSDTSIWGHADCLRYALETLGLTDITLVGMGVGGGVAQVLATRLYRSGVARLVLINSYAYQHAYAENWPLPEMSKRHDPDLPRQTPLDQLLKDLRATLPQAAANTLPDARVRAYVDEWNSELGKEMLFQHVRQMVPDYMNAVSTDVKLLDIPILLIWGERDTVTPVSLGKRIAAENPHAKLRIIPGAGHLILDDAASAVASALRDVAG